MSLVSASSPHCVHPPNEMLSRFGNATLSSADRATNWEDSHRASMETSNGSSADVAASGHASTLRIVCPHDDRPTTPAGSSCAYSAGTSSSATECSSTFCRVVRCTHPPAYACADDAMAAACAW